MCEEVPMFPEQSGKGRSVLMIDMHTKKIQCELGYYKLGLDLNVAVIAIKKDSVRMLHRSFLFN